MYIFGDGLSTTNDNTGGSSSFYGQRYSNGRVWVEVLAQRQGLTISNNLSGFDWSSSALVTNVQNFTISPAIATNALFIIWVNNSDLYDETELGDTNMTEWMNAIDQSQTNHFKAVTNLYAKGVRTLIMPNAVDVSTIPLFDAYPNTNFIHQRCIDYNIAFSNTVSRAVSSCPGLKIYVPDFFALLTNVLAHPANYGLTNALFNGRSTSAAQTISPLTVTNNPGTNYIYWDATDPSAKFHAVIGDVAQQLISPVQISGITAFTGSNRLDLVNVPVGLNGFVDGCTNMATSSWSNVQNITSTNNVQSVFVPATGPLQFYRLRFPYAWSFP